MAYLNLDNNAYPVTERDIRQANPNTSFPTPFVAPIPYVWVFPTPTPTYDPIIEVARELAPVLKPNGKYEQAWEVVPRFTEYTDDQGVTHTVAEQNAAAIAADIKSKVPVAVSPRQIRQALTASNLRTAVEAAVAAGDQDLKDWWEFATVFERNHPMVIGMATGLGVTEIQLDQLFTLAGSL